MSQQQTQKYLATYAEAETHSLSKVLNSFYPYQAAVVIPAYDELQHYVNRWAQHPCATQHLLITVVNAPDSAANHAQNNLALWRHLEHYFTLEAQADNLYYFTQGALKILAVDRFSCNGIPPKQGVGLARKIGCDLGVSLHHHGIQQRPWIYSSDADAHLPNNYFSATAGNNAQHSALIFDFKHVAGEAAETVFLATQTYEAAIKYFYRQLKYANSPYAYYTLGSTLAINTGSYAQVRGFPKRAGGEDFYLLNKLAKMGSIFHCQEICIDIEARPSHRVPFGTGPAVTNMIQRYNNFSDYAYYSPEIFVELKRWLQLASQLWPFIHQSAEIPWPTKNCQHTLERLGIVNFLKHAQKQCKSAAVFEKAFQDWFDAFMTLKFIHDMQSHYYPAPPLKYCLANEHFTRARER